MKKHLVCHFYAAEHKRSTDFLNHISQNINIFDGYKIITFSVPNNISPPKLADTRISGVYNQDYVNKSLSKLYELGFYILSTTNTENRESNSFFTTSGPLLKALLNTDANNDWLFYCHNKGSSHPEDNSVIDYWNNILWQYNLYDYKQRVEPLLNNIDYDFIGALKTYCDFWHYTGTFFWARAQNLLSKGLDPQYNTHTSSLEFLPGTIGPKKRMFDLSYDDYNLYGKNPYHSISWQKPIPFIINGELQPIIDTRKYAPD